MMTPEEILYFYSQTSMLITESDEPEIRNYMNNQNRFFPRRSSFPISNDPISSGAGLFAQFENVDREQRARQAEQIKERERPMFQSLMDAEHKLWYGTYPRTPEESFHGAEVEHNLLRQEESEQDHIENDKLGGFVFGKNYFKKLSEMYITRANHEAEIKRIKGESENIMAIVDGLKTDNALLRQQIVELHKMIDSITYNYRISTGGDTIYPPQKRSYDTYNNKQSSSILQMLRKSFFPS